MKEQLLNTIEKMLDDNYDFLSKPALFKWRYEERPELEFQLLIAEIPPEEMLH